MSWRASEPRRALPSPHGLQHVLAAGLARARLGPAAEPAPTEVPRAKRLFAQVEAAKKVQEASKVLEGRKVLEGGITKEKKKAFTFVDAIQDDVAVRNEAVVFKHVCETIDTYCVTTGSEEAVACVQCVAANAYFADVFDEQVLNYLCKFSDTKYTFEQLAGAYMLHLWNEQTQAMSMGANIFDDPSKGQFTRDVFKDADVTALFQDYFEELTAFCNYVQSGEWSKAGSVLLRARYHLASLAIQFFGLPALARLPAGSGPGGDVLRRLELWGEIRDSLNIPWLGIAYSSRRQWVEQTIRLTQAGRVVGTSVYMALMQFGNLGAGDMSPTIVEEVLTRLWRANALAGPVLGPLAKIGFHIFFVLLRAAFKVEQFKINSIKEYLRLNSVADAREWAKELVANAKKAVAAPAAP